MKRSPVFYYDDDNTNSHIPIYLADLEDFIEEETGRRLDVELLDDATFYDFVDKYLRDRGEGSYA